MSVRWTANSPMQKSLEILFTNETIEKDSRAVSVFNRYPELWHGVNKNTFGKHFTNTKNKMFGITTPGLKAPVLPSAAVSVTDVDNPARNLFPFPPTGIDMSVSVATPGVANSK